MIQRFFHGIRTKYINLDYESHRGPNTTFIQKLGFLFSKHGAKKIARVTRRTLNQFLPKPDSYQLDPRYPLWFAKENSRERLRQVRKSSRILKHKPLVSVLLVVPDHIKIYDVTSTFKSIQSQIYKNWEVCISNASSKLHNRLTRLAGRNVKYTFTDNDYDYNAALELATGDHVATLHVGDLLSETSLFEMVSYFTRFHDADMLYSDDDLIIDSNKHGKPFFKSDFCEDSFLSRNYLGSFLSFRSLALLREPGFNPDFGPAQISELLLRLLATNISIHHVAKILCHRQNQDQKIGEQHERAVLTYLKAKNETAEISSIDGGYLDITYQLTEKPKISIIIPTHDAANLVKTCLDSIFTLSTYQNIEVILISNNSNTREFFELVETYRVQEPERFICITYDHPFNFSALQNIGAERATGKYLVLLNNDTEVVTVNWLELMLGHAQRSSIGAVGPKLLFENGTIQHCGVLMGMHGLANHHFAGRPPDIDGYYGNVRAATNYSAVTAACLMVSKRKFLEVDGFEESLAVEFNDVDFCLKLAEAGYNNIYLPSVSLYHYESMSRGDINSNNEDSARSLRERAYIEDKWLHVIRNDPCYNINLSVWKPYEGLRMDDEEISQIVQNEIREQRTNPLVEGRLTSTGQD
ncbi:MAG: glycosyltransferase family 2 protein [bacterium]